jgi:hypothetical protein
MYLMERKTQMETYIREAARVEEETEAARTRVANLRTALSTLNEQAEQFQNDIAAANVQVNPVNEAAGRGDRQVASHDYGAEQNIEEYVAPEENMEIDVVIGGGNQPLDALVHPNAPPARSSQRRVALVPEPPLNPVRVFVFITLNVPFKHKYSNGTKVRT